VLPNPPQASGVAATTVLAVLVTIAICTSEEPKPPTMSRYTYQLSQTTKLVMYKGDITKWHGDAIVNAGARIRTCVVVMLPS
jgi:hypothetical protein